MSKKISVETNDKIIEIDIKYNKIKLAIAVSISVIPILTKNDLSRIIPIILLILIMLGKSHYELVEGAYLTVGPYTVEIRLNDKGD